jgi:hypothetical protein
MDIGRARELPARLEGVRRRFERWRETRRGRARIPDSLWAAAARAAGRYGISRTAGVLGVNSRRLKEHLGAQAAAVGGETETKDAARFVELSAFAGSGACQCLLELEDGSGAKLRVRLRGTGMPGTIRRMVVAALGRSFWNRQP